MPRYSYTLIDVDTSKNKSNVVLRSLHSYGKRYSSSHWSTSTTNSDHCDDEYRCRCEYTLRYSAIVDVVRIKLK